jgi:hypothetical protein
MMKGTGENLEGYTTALLKRITFYQHVHYSPDFSFLLLLLLAASGYGHGVYDTIEYLMRMLHCTSIHLQTWTLLQFAEARMA